MTKKVCFEVYDPSGGAGEPRPSAPRLDGLNGKKIGIVTGSLGEADRLLDALTITLQGHAPDSTFVRWKELPSVEDIDKHVANVNVLIELGCQAVIVGNGGRGGGSAACGRVAAEIERAGIPAVVVSRQGFEETINKAFQGSAENGEVSQVGFSESLFLPEGDFDLPGDSADCVIYALTKWRPQEKRAARRSSWIEAAGIDHEDATARMNLLFLRNMWSDGLPLVPPTSRLVDWILQGTDRTRNESIGRVMPRGGTATIETIAVNLAMAGGRPEYLPVLLAAMQAILQPRSRHQSWNSTTCGTYPAVVVNGPVARHIRLNSGYGCLGPNPMQPAGASIGRAIRLLLQNVGGAVPQAGTMSVYGSPAKYVNVVFAEDENGLPAGWKSLAEERGSPAGEGVVTVLPVSGATNVGGTETNTENQARAMLDRYAGFMGAPNSNYYSLGAFNGSPGILLMARGTAEGLARFGWSKDKIKRYLWDNSKISRNKLRDIDWLKPGSSSHQLTTDDFDQDPVPISRNPENIIIVVAGGEQSGHGYWMQVGCCTEGPTSMKIILPANWESLITQAGEDLGPAKSL